MVGGGGGGGSRRRQHGTESQTMFCHDTQVPELRYSVPLPCRTLLMQNIQQQSITVVLVYSRVCGDGLFRSGITVQ